MKLSGKKRSRVYQNSKIVSGPYHPPQKPISEMAITEILREAAAVGLSYGQYVARYDPPKDQPKRRRGNK
ncbi:hypothetical protein [Angelakisella massiliensis]|uniref:hypothetical protein n=1 Tax=Angelakisella massiliensis TaxID=1871018 RepID=UPI0024B28174|nr:hypothetical protein [Angelakisella massiliensis]